jgi:DNA polymerase I
MLKPRLFLIDATAFCYRAFYAVRGLSTSYGQPTNAIYGFLNILNKLLKDKKPQYLAVCFDVSRKTFRSEKFAEYKAQRQAMPDGLSSQIPIIKEIMAAYRIPVFEQEGFEADDIIATLACKAKAEGLPSTVVSSDKDLLQLVEESVDVFNPQKEESVTYDIEKVREKFGLDPRQIPDLIALSGDTIDNIPKIPGISEKKAVELLTEFGSVEALIEQAELIKTDKLKDAVKSNIAQIKLNKELACLDSGMKLDFSLDMVKAAEPDYQELFKLFKRLEFKGLLKNLPVSDSPDDPGAGLETIDDKAVKELIKQGDDLFVYGGEAANLVFSCNDRNFTPGNIGPHLKAVLADSKIRKIGHDLKKIKLALARDDIKLEGLFFDTMIAAYLINQSKSDYGLNELAWDYFERSIKPESITPSAGLELTKKLKPELETRLKEKSLGKLFREMEMPLVEVLAEMEIAGIKLDLHLLKELSSELEKRLAGLISDIYEISGCQFNINSPKQLSAVLFEKLKLPVIKKTKTGPSTDEEVLNRLAGQHKLPAALLEYRQLTKLKNTYIDALPELVDPKTNRVHTTFNQTGTETGRLSSSNPNLQNIPVKTDLGRKIRAAVISFSKESVLLAFDYSQIELRILAHMSKDEVLLEAFRKGDDIHKKTASLIYDVPEDAVSDEMRDTAKRVNFGIIYGLSAYGLSRDLNIPPDQAQGFIDAYFARYPKVKDLIDKEIKQAEEDGFVTTILGRRRYLPEINNKNQNIRMLAQRQAVNTPIQGSASDLIKLAMVDIHNEIKKRKLKGQMILQIHDELVFDVGKDEIAEFVKLVKERMEHVLELDVPVRVSIKQGKNWLEMQEIDQQAA